MSLETNLFPEFFFLCYFFSAGTHPSPRSFASAGPRLDPCPHWACVHLTRNLSVNDILNFLLVFTENQLNDSTFAAPVFKLRGPPGKCPQGRVALLSQTNMSDLKIWVLLVHKTLRKAALFV